MTLSACARFRSWKPGQRQGRAVPIQLPRTLLPVYRGAGEQWRIEKMVPGKASYPSFRHNDSQVCRKL